MKVKQVNIAPNGPKLSQLVAGTMTWGEWGVDYSPEQMAMMIEHCVELGITTFDHADIYGHYSTEATFGEALAHIGGDIRDRIQLVTKCGIRLKSHRRPQNRLKSYDTSKEYIIRSAEQSLTNLQTDHLDLFLIHRPDPLMDPQEVAAAFAHLKEAGKVLHFGVSNFTPTQYEMLSQCTELVTNQVECNPLHTDPLFDGTFDQMINTDCRPMIWSPLGGAKYFKGEGTSVLRVRDVAKSLSSKYGNVGEDIILLAWLLRHPAGCIPVLGTTKKDRIRDARLALKTDLDRQDWFALLEAAQGKEVA
ncbi:aldo/keto reductase family oxidoreductase [Lewinella sp. W8]|uniref:aldo/keto reductase n=1 Tax=Lewinella sp. W8 TaxID=2528208 RepID=UPI00106846E0|nr:aldo/keto reductase [Lewinella sp. W8]MTB49703.1 aldo/keto reductase [Lewinella sp. W8]